MLGLPCRLVLVGVIQAVAGYGVPVAVCAPLMIAAGFEPLTAAAASLVGHAWAITFGSMASSFYTLTLSTKIPPEISGNWVGLTSSYPRCLLAGSCPYRGGAEGVKKGFPKIVVVGAAMGLCAVDCSQDRFSPGCCPSRIACRGRSYCNHVVSGIGTNGQSGPVLRRGGRQLRRAGKQDIHPWPWCLTTRS